MAAEFKKGEIILIPCETQPGAFPYELLVTIDTGEKRLSGFVQVQYILDSGAGKHLKALVVDVKPSTITVRMPGSFFTAASGTTGFPVTWMREHVEAQAV